MLANRFAKDLAALDLLSFQTAKDLHRLAVELSVLLLLLESVNLSAALLFALYSFFVLRFQNRFRSVLREVSRLAKTASTPMLSFLLDAVKGRVEA